MFGCPRCKTFYAKSYWSVLKHIEEVHQFECGFKISCHFCSQTYTKVSGYRSHLYRKHNDKQWLDTSPMPDLSEVGSDLCADGSLACDVHDFDYNVERKRQAALFILKAKEERMITQKALDGILKDVQGLLNYQLCRIQKQVIQALNDANINDLPDIDRLFGDVSSASPFTGLETEYLQTKYFRDNFRLLEPVERVLGQQTQANSSNSHSSRYESYYYIPLLQSLQLLLTNVSVHEGVFKSHKSHDHWLRDFCDGEAFANHPLFSSNPVALQIQLYYDDIDVCNPIGSKSVIHKLGLFYYCLGNIHPLFRSKLQSILLLAVAETSLISKYGINIILDPFVEEMKELESVDGVPFLINGNTQYLRGALTSVVADNPASNLIGGFKNLSSAYRKCRDCLATSEEIQTMFTAEEFVPRTKAVHERHCSSLNGPAHAIVTTTYGVKQNSVLNNLEYFHVTSGLPPDIMHNIFEGVAVFEFKSMLSVFIQDLKLFTLTTLNRRIQHFPFGFPDAKNKPLPLPTHILSTSPNDAIKQSSSQTWCLIRLLPLMIGDLVPDDNPYWNCFLILLNIVDFVCAPETTTGIAGHLRDLIKEHHVMFHQLYPHNPMTPKFHYLIHMPQWIVRHGPLVRMWCMRYEAKHQYFKRWATIMGNFKNIAKTLAMHHQRYMCYHQTAGDMKPSFTVGPTTSVCVGALSYQDELLHCCPSLTQDTYIYRVKWVERRGTVYKTPCIVFVEFQCDIPIFGQVQDILFIQEKFFLVLQLLKAEVFNSHFHAYEVQRTTLIYVCEVDSLVDHHPLWIYQSYNPHLLEKSFIPLKYYVLSSTD